MKRQVIRISTKGKMNLVKIHNRNPYLRFSRYGYGVYVNGKYDDNEIIEIIENLRNKTGLPLKMVDVTKEEVAFDFGDVDSQLVFETNYDENPEEEYDYDNDPYGLDEQAKEEQWYYSVGRNL